MTSYSWDPELYEKSSASQQRFARDIISKIRLQGDERILDIGCGDGKITAEIASRVPSGFVLGVDISLDMLSHAMRWFPQSEHPNLSFAYADASSLDFDSEFDIVLSFACLHWIEDHAPVLRGINRSLRPGGRAVLQFGGKGNVEEVVKVVNRLIEVPRYSKYFSGFKSPYNFYDVDRYMAFIDRSGISPSSLQLAEKEIVHNGSDGMISWLKSTWHPYLDRLPDELKDEFVIEVANRYLCANPAEDDGSIRIKAARLELEFSRSD